MTPKNSRGLLIAQGSSISSGLKFTNWVLQLNLDRDLAQIIESSVLPQGGFLVLIEGVTKSLQNLQDGGERGEVLRSFRTHIVDDLHPHVLPAFYSLQNDVTPGDAILICECENMIDALITANVAANFDPSIRLLDVRSGRGTGGVPLTIVMGPAPSLTRWEEEMKLRSLGDPERRALIAHPHPELTELFV